MTITPTAPLPGSARFGVSAANALHARYGVTVAEAADLGVAELELLAEDAGARLADARAIDILTWATLTFGDSLVVASSMSDGVVAHLAARAFPGVKVAFLDTGLHFAETLGTRDAIASTLDIELINVTPELTVDEQATQLGPQLWSRDPDRCCQLRKVAPLARVLAPFTAWATGIRGDETAARVGTPVVHWDARREMVKVNPLARWSHDEVTAYAERYGVLVNPLQQLGYASIGCAPCTRPVQAGEGTRAGRWSGADKSECGIHA